MKQVSRVMYQESCIKSHESGVRQKGQVIVILLLLMLVALSIGLAVTQKSVTDVTTSSLGEQSSRAFSAAEAGIEKALEGTVTTNSPITLDNQSTVTVATSPLLPVAGSGDGIEYPPIGRETTAQFWFTNPSNPANFYNDDDVTIYFGNENTTDFPAVAVEIVMLSGGSYYTQNYYLDSTIDSTARPLSNNFDLVTGCGSRSMPKGILGDGHKFYCERTISGIPNLGGSGTCLNPCKLILARVRFLYTNENHKLALAPIGGSGAEFPPQAQVYNSRGVSGQSEKLIQAFRVIDVVPPWFDFALFSVNQISK